VFPPELSVAAVVATGAVSRKHHPAIAAHRAAMSAQEKLAEQITNFAGSMSFVYIHTVWFAVWIILNAKVTPLSPFDKYPFGLLTLIVSLEAIFLSTFVMIGQNRQSRFSQIKADHDFELQKVQLENQAKQLDLQRLDLAENTKLTKEVHSCVGAAPAAEATVATDGPPAP
jgi:uncharacterized membrane protein